VILPKGMKPRCSKDFAMARDYFGSSIRFS
jgi:hypothetical protein